MTALLWLAMMGNTAEAYRFYNNIPSWFGGNCSGPLTLPGTSATFYQSPNDPSLGLSGNEHAAMREGAFVWNAGPGTVNRGALWSFEFGGITTNTGSVTDLVNQVFTIPHGVGVQVYGYGNDWLAYAPIRANANCTEIMHFDVMFNESSSYQLLAVSTHEFGHVLGLAHNRNSAAVMYSHEMAEIGLTIQLNEDDYVALTVLKPGGSTGRNFSLSRHVTNLPGTINNPRPTHTQWGRSGEWHTYTPAQCGATIPVDPNDQDSPAPILAIVNGTATSYASIPIVWTLSANYTCNDFDDIEIGWRYPTMSSNTPYAVSPNGGYHIPLGTPPGDYIVCARINPAPLFYMQEAQASYDDNVVHSHYFQTWSITCP